MQQASKINTVYGKKYHNFYHIYIYLYIYTYIHTQYTDTYISAQVPNMTWHIKRQVKVNNLKYFLDQTSQINIEIKKEKNSNAVKSKR